jgi:hypothetical protein
LSASTKRRLGLSLETGELKDASEVTVVEEDRETRRQKALEALSRRLNTSGDSSI